MNYEPEPRIYFNINYIYVFVFTPEAATSDV